MRLPDNVSLCEVGLRDGLQNEKVMLSTEQKEELARDIIAAGFPVVELGSFMSPKAVPQMADTDELFQRLGQVEGVELRALIANKKGVERAIACGCSKVKLNVSASLAHNLANFNMTPEQSVSGFAECVAAASAANIASSGAISMPFGSPWDKHIPLNEVCAIIEAYLAVGVTEISLSDTAGVAVPSQVYHVCTTVGLRYPQVDWWLHFHNTRGMALANIVAAMQAGITRFDTAFAGRGGCPFVPGAAGNISSEDLLHMLDGMGVATGIDLDAAISIGRKVSDMLGSPADSYVLRAGKSTELIRELPTGQGKNQVANR